MMQQETFIHVQSTSQRIIAVCEVVLVFLTTFNRNPGWTHNPRA